MVYRVQEANMIAQRMNLATPVAQAKQARSVVRALGPPVQFRAITRFYGPLEAPVTPETAPRILRGPPEFICNGLHLGPRGVPRHLLWDLRAHQRLFFIPSPPGKPWGTHRGGDWGPSRGPRPMRSPAPMPPAPRSPPSRFAMIRSLSGFHACAAGAVAAIAGERGCDLLPRGPSPCSQSAAAMKPQQAAAAALASAVMAGSAQALTYDDFQGLTYLQASSRKEAVVPRARSPSGGSLIASRCRIIWYRPRGSAIVGNRARGRGETRISESFRFRARRTSPASLGRPWGPERPLNCRITPRVPGIWMKSHCGATSPLSIAGEGLRPRQHLPRHRGGHHQPRRDPLGQLLLRQVLPRAYFLQGESKALPPWKGAHAPPRPRCPIDWGKRPGIGSLFVKIVLGKSHSHQIRLCDGIAGDTSWCCWPEDLSRLCTPSRPAAGPGALLPRGRSGRPYCAAIPAPPPPRR